MRRAIYEDDVIKLLDKGWKSGVYPVASNIHALPSAQPELTDVQAIEHLQETGWMQNHDKQMYEMGLKEQLADDSDSYDALLPSAQPEIIHCCECKWLQCNMRPDGYLPKGVDEFECRHWCGYCDPMDFCSYAERASDGQSGSY